MRRAVVQFDPAFNVGHRIKFRYDKVEPEREGFAHDVVIRYTYDGTTVRRIVETYTIKVGESYFDRVGDEEIDNVPPYPFMAKVIPIYMKYAVGERYKDEEVGDCEVVSYYIEGKKSRDRNLMVTVFRYVRTPDNLIKKVKESEQGVKEDGT
jgi:hypothetical protein